MNRKLLEAAFVYWRNLASSNSGTKLVDMTFEEWLEEVHDFADREFLRQHRLSTLTEGE